MFQHEYAHPQQRGPIAYEVLSKFCAQLTCVNSYLFGSISRGCVKSRLDGLHDLPSENIEWHDNLDLIILPHINGPFTIGWGGGPLPVSGHNSVRQRPWAAPRLSAAGAWANFIRYSWMQRPCNDASGCWLADHSDLHQCMTSLRLLRSF